MKKARYLSFFFPCILLIIFASLTTHDDIMVHLETWHYNVPQEKVYVKHDKPFYVLGERIWFKAYVVNASNHSSLIPSQTLYVELRDSSGVVQASKNIRLEEGAGNGDFLLDPAWSSGTYHLHAYTSYMLNFDQEFHFIKTFKVGSIRDSNPTSDPNTGLAPPHIDFYPEGGHLVCGLPQVVAVRSVDDAGHPMAVKVQVIDQDQTLVTLFVTDEHGFGKFSFSPDCAKKYYLKILESQSLIDIRVPTPKKSGFILSVKKAHQERLFIQVSCTDDLRLDGCALIGHSRGANLWLQNGLSGQMTTLEIPSADLTPGVHHITLFDQESRPRAERLFYRHSDPEAIRIEVADSMPRNTAQEIKLHLHEKLQEGESLQAALSIYQGNLGYPTQTLNSYLLLDSDLRGVITNPMQYFPLDGGPKLKEIDLLMMTHGWRRFDWQAVINQQFPVMNHLPENGFTFMGEIEPSLPSKRKNLPAEIQLSLIGDGFNAFAVSADSVGRFYFRDIEILDTTKVLVKALRKEENEKRKKRKDAKLLDFILQSREAAIDASVFAKRIPTPIDGEVVKEYVDFARYNRSIVDSYAEIWSIDLDEVVVSGDRKDPDVVHHEKTMLYNDPDSRLLVKDAPGAIAFNNIFDFLQARVPGLEVRGSFPNKTVRIRGTSTIQGDANAQFMLDGAYVPNDLLNYYPMDQVAFVDVIRSLSKATVLGGTAGGIVAIYSKSTMSDQTLDLDQKSISLYHPGYYQAISYYVPSRLEVNAQYTENRTTLYWNPDVSLDIGSNDNSFYTSSNKGHYYVVAEGITNQGRIFQGIKSIEVH